MDIELYEALTSVNVSPEKAKAVTEAFRREAETRLATKDDLRVTASELRVEMAGVRVEMAGLRTEVRTEIANLRTGMHQMFKDQTRWLGGFIFAAVGLILVGIKLLP